MPETASSVRNSAIVLYSLAAFVIIASYVFVHLMGYGFFFFTQEGLALSTQSFPFPILILFVVGFITPSLHVGGVFLFTWTIYAICFLWAWKWRQTFHNVLGGSMSGKPRSIFSSFLFAMPLFSSMVLTAVLAIIYSQGAVGIETGVIQLPHDPHEAFLDLAYAPLIEELAFRLVPIGLLMVLYVFSAAKNVQVASSVGSRLKLFLYAFIYPEGAKRMAGLPNVSEHGTWRGISSSEWVMVVVSSAVFGLAHVLVPAGWEIGKITSTFVQGFFFAVAYIAYGFEAPILLHWFFNYYLYFFDPNVAEGFFPTTIGLLSIIEILILVVGIFGWVAFAEAGLRKFVRLRKKQSVQPHPVTHPSQSL